MKTNSLLLIATFILGTSVTQAETMTCDLFEGRSKVGSVNTDMPNNHSELRKLRKVNSALGDCYYANIIDHGNSSLMISRCKDPAGDVNLAALQANAKKVDAKEYQRSKNTSFKLKVSKYSAKCRVTGTFDETGRIPSEDERTQAVFEEFLALTGVDIREVFTEKDNTPERSYIERHGFVTDLNETQSIMNSKKETYVAFFGMDDQCGPCKLSMPILDAVKESAHYDVKVVHLGESRLEREYLEKLNVTGYPTMFKIKNGEIQKSHRGAISLEQTLNFLK